MATDRPAATPSRERVTALLDAYYHATRRFVAACNPEFGAPDKLADETLAARAALDAALASLADDAERWRASQEAMGSDAPLMLNSVDLWIHTRDLVDQRGIAVLAQGGETQE